MLHNITSIRGYFSISTMMHLFPTPLSLYRHKLGSQKCMLSLIKYEIINAIWHLRPQSKPLGGFNCLDRELSLQEIDRVTDDCRNKLQTRYLKYCNMDLP